MNRREIQNNILEILLLGVSLIAANYVVDSLTPPSVNPPQVLMRGTQEGQDCSVLGGYMTCTTYVVGADGVRQYVGEPRTKKVANYNLNIF